MNALRAKAASTNRAVVSAGHRRSSPGYPLRTGSRESGGIAASRILALCRFGLFRTAEISEASAWSGLGGIERPNDENVARHRF
jgi:hypothetical protein